jgi:hypothetical protein
MRPDARCRSFPRPGPHLRLQGLLLGLLATGCGTNAATLPFTEARALCESLLPQVTGEFTCRMDELQAPTRTGAEPSYDAAAKVVFRTSGTVDHFSDLRASGPASDPNVPAADCVAATLRRLRVPERTDALTLRVELQYRESEAITPTAAVRPDMACALTIPVRAP